MQGSNTCRRVRRDKKHPIIGELQLLRPDSREFLNSLDFSRFSSAEAASENLEKSREPRNSHESGLRTGHYAFKAHNRSQY